MTENLPELGTSHGRTIDLTWPMCNKSGLIPPWQQKILSSITAATGRVLKTSVKVLNSLML
jgi:hypothetical protein